MSFLSFHGAQNFFFFVICLFRAAPEAYGGYQARGPIGAAAAGLCHNSRQCRILNPLIEARDQTCNLMVPSWIRFNYTTTGTPGLSSLTPFTQGLGPVFLPLFIALSPSCYSSTSFPMSEIRNAGFVRIIKRPEPHL